MAEFDLLTNQSQYRDFVEAKLKQTLDAYPGFSSDETYDALAYGHASIKAYAAYKSPTFLDFAVQSWTYNRQYTLSQSDISSGKISVRDFPISTICAAWTSSKLVPMVGGTFNSTVDRNDSLILGTTTGRVAYSSFLVLSALLAETTNDSVYLQAANDSATFIQAHLFDNDGRVMNSIHAAKDFKCFADDYPWSFNSGLTIQGLAVLSSMTNSTSTRVLLNNIIFVVATERSWQTFDGISDDTGGPRVVDGLRAVYTRNVSKSDYREDIKGYLGVQYNAVLDLSTTTNSNLYSRSWLGPPDTNFTGAGQTGAISALLAAIPLLPAPSSTGPSSGSPSQTGNNNSPPLPPQSGKAPVGAIVGGVIGGLALLAAVLLSIWALRQRQRNTDASRSVSSPVMSGLIIEPFAALGSSQSSGMAPPETESVRGLASHPASEVGNSRPPTYNSH
ncbi:hypothetical protein C8J57DRAFT_1730664 [Mycena rebaudengoi]|nr:hypothetical protein C8J57DRAFT_1730664 [Mycena rebaudengoi]